MQSFTIQDFNSAYPDDEACLAEIFNNRYGNLDICPRCTKKTKFYPLKKRRVYSCKLCGYQISPTAGTIFHKSRTPLKKWFFALYLIANSKNGVAALEMQRHLGVTYKCAYRICKQVRTMFSDNKDQLKGIVEMDETYYGGKGWNKRFRYVDSWEDKECLFGMVEREGNVRAIHVPNNGKRTLFKHIETHVDKDALIMTDELPAYKNLPSIGYKHKSVLHRKHYVDGDIYTNNIENFWSQLKRSINGTYHVVSKKQLQTYVDEFAWKRNHRKMGKILPLMTSKASKKL